MEQLVQTLHVEGLIHSGTCSPKSHFSYLSLLVSAHANSVHQMSNWSNYQLFRPFVLVHVPADI